MPRLFRRSKDVPIEEANVLPVMNIMFLLIPALLLSMEVASLAAISVSPPTFHPEPAQAKKSDPEKPPTSLRIRIYEEGFGIELRGARDEGDQGSANALSGPTIPLDYAALSARVAELRPLLEEGSNLEISAEGQITMQVLVSTIDAVQDLENPLPLIVSEA